MERVSLLEKAKPKKGGLPKWLIALIVTALIIGAIVLAFFPFWKDIFEMTEDSVRTPAQLRVYTPESIGTIYIDGNEKGKTQDGTTLIPSISPGDRTVSIIRESSNPDFYVPFEREIYFEEGAEVEIQWTAGPTLDASEGVIKYLKKQPLPKENPSVTMVVYPPDADIFWDDAQFEPGVYAITVEDDQRHTIKVEREGYESKTINIEIDDTVRSRGLDLMVEIYLYMIPVWQ